METTFPGNQHCVETTLYTYTGHGDSSQHNKEARNTLGCPDPQTTQAHYSRYHDSNRHPKTQTRANGVSRTSTWQKVDQWVSTKSTSIQKRRKGPESINLPTGSIDWSMARHPLSWFGWPIHRVGWPNKAKTPFPWWTQNWSTEMPIRSTDFDGVRTWPPSGGFKLCLNHFGW